MDDSVVCGEQTRIFFHINKSIDPFTAKKEKIDDTEKIVTPNEMRVSAGNNCVPLAQGFLYYPQESLPLLSLV